MSAPETGRDSRSGIGRALEETIRGLAQAQSTISVAVAALRQQASGIDEDIAAVLSRGAADRMQEEVEKLESILAALDDGSDSL